MTKAINTLVCAAFTSLCMLAFALPAAAQGQAAGERSAIRFAVVDSDGSPLPGAQVTVGEGLAHYESYEDGSVSVTCSPREYVSVSKDGYKSVRLRADVLADTGTAVLVAEMMFAGEGDDVQLPFKTEKRRWSLGSTVTVSGDELARYSSVDIRNALTGVIPGVEVRENYGQVGLSPLEHTGQYGATAAMSVTSRGRSLMYMVDDVPVQINEMPLDPEQIESVTVIRDGLEKTLYGPTAADGIISIKTKKGSYNDRYLNVSVESGVNTVDRMPKYANAAQYAQLNNIARNNSGLSMLYSRSDVAAYALGDPDSKTHPAVDFRSMLLKNTMMYDRESVSSGGGNDVVKYYAHLGHTGQDDIYDMGPASGYNHVNLNGNLDIRLNRFIGAQFGILSSIGVRKSNNYGYGTLNATELPSILDDINTIPPLSFPIYADNSDDLETPWYAVTSQYTQNPVANILENGSYTETIRGAMFNIKLDVDLPFVLKGLKSTTYASYASTNLVRLGTSEDYAAYILTEGYDADGNAVVTPVQSASHTVRQSSSKSRLLDYYSNRFYLVEKLDWSKTVGEHDFSVGADYMITKRSQKFISEHRREINFGLDASYAYAGKYLASLALNEHGTYSLLDSWSFSPAVGLGWIVSNEDFMSGSAAIDFLKLRVQGSLLRYDSLTSANRDTDNYSWNSNGQRFGPYTTGQWFGSTTGSSVNRTYASMLGNPDLHLETRKEISGGVDLRAFGGRLDVSVTGYNFVRDGIITQMSNVVPLLAGTSTGSLYMNWDKYSYSGLEISAGWKDKLGPVDWSVSGWVSAQCSKILKIDELDYAEDYRSRVGKSVSAIWGLKYLGQFSSDEETLAIPQLYDDELKAGDFKYQDMNGDGYVDASDQCVIGDSVPKLIGAVNAKLGWNGFDLALTGTFRAFYDAQLTNSWFWNGWGDSNYSYYVMKNLGKADAPRLTYNKVNNNYQLSERWIRDGSFFKLQCVEIGYSLPLSSLRAGGLIRQARIWCRANNLLTLSGIEDVDPEALSSGITNYPLMRSFTGGVKLTF